jgi:hypothetical protein
MHITADYNYAFSHDIGAGAYDRIASLKKKATKWVSKNRHTSHKDAFPSKTFQTIAEALASAEDDDVIQIEDSGIYDESDNISNITLPPEVRSITLQAANLTVPAIKVNERLKLGSSNSVKRITLNGLLIAGGPLTLPENFDKIALISCTVNPGNYHDDEKRSLGIRIEQQEKQEEVRKQDQQQQYDKTPIATTTLKNENNGYAIWKSNNNASSKEISLIKSISVSIIADDSVSLISLEDSIVHNPEGLAISVKENNKKEEKDPVLKLEAKRSTILGKYGDGYVLKLKDICCSDCILTDIIDVKKNEKEREDKTDNYETSCTSFLRYSRYEEGSKFENLGKDNSAIVDCTIDRPIFISTTFGHPAYLHLDRLTSKSILEGAENTLEMGAFNKNYKPLRMRNLNLRLQEFLPLGIKSGVIYTY